MFPFPLGSLGGRVLCTHCASFLFVAFDGADRWTLCRVCDAGWLRDMQLDTTVRVGPPALLRAEGNRA